MVFPSVLSPFLRLPISYVLQVLSCQSRPFLTVFGSSYDALDEYETAMELYILTPSRRVPCSVNTISESLPFSPHSRPGRTTTTSIIATKTTMRRANYMSCAARTQLVVASEAFRWDGAGEELIQLSLSRDHIVSPVCARISICESADIEKYS